MTTVYFGGVYIKGSPEDVQKAVQIIDQYTSRQVTPVMPGSGDTQAQNEIILTWPEIGSVLIKPADVNPDPKDVLLTVVSL